MATDSINMFLNKNFWKIITHSIAFLGIILLFCNLMGWFTNKERLNLYNQIIEEPYRLSIDYPGVKEFLEKFYDSSKNNGSFKSSEIKGIMLNWVGIGGDRPMTGNLVLWLDGDRFSNSLCTLDALRAWAQENPFYNWISFVILTLGLIGAILIDTLPWLRGKINKRT